MRYLKYLEKEELFKKNKKKKKRRRKKKFIYRRKHSAKAYNAVIKMRCLTDIPLKRISEKVGIHYNTAKRIMKDFRDDKCDLQPNKMGRKNRLNR